MALDSILQQLRSEQRQAEDASSRQQEQLKALQEKIKAGESTGDPITDRVILQFQGSQEAEEKIQGLYHSLKENENGLVAVEEAYEYSFGEQGCFGGRFSMYFVALHMGRIREPFLRIKEIKDAEALEWMFTDAEIATDPRAYSYVQSNVFDEKSYFPVRKKPTISRNTTLSISLAAYLGRPLSQPLVKGRIGELRGKIWRGLWDRFGDHPDYRLAAYKIHVGTAAVDERFKEVRFILHGRDDERSRTSRDYGNKDFYAEMCKLLLTEDRENKTKSF